MDESTKNDTAVTTYRRRDVNFELIPSFTSYLFVHLRQLQNDYQVQYQHDKHAINELNERLRHFVERVQQLEAQNERYITQIINFKRSSGELHSTDVEWNQHFLRLQSDLMTASQGSIDFDLEIELYQLQTAIYQQLIEIEQKSKDERVLKLEQEVKQSSSTLTSLRTSNSDLGREVEGLYTARDDAYQKYLKLTQDWSQMRRRCKEWELSKELLKNQITFYKNLRSHSTRGYVSVSTDTFNVKEYQKLEFDKIIKKIRHDFEQLCNALHLEMTKYYDLQLQEVKTGFEKVSRYEVTNIETHSRSYQTLNVEYEKVQQTLSYERETQVKLEATYSTLESELQSIRRQNEDRLSIYLKDFESSQENIVIIAYDIEEMRRRKTSLEAELIIYRNLLDSYGVYEYTVRAISPPPMGGTVTRKFIVKSQKKGSVAIRECPPDGLFVSLLNHSPDKIVNISKWSIKRNVDGKGEIRYTLPEDIQLPPGGELRIYSQQGAAVVKSSTNYPTVVSSKRQELVSNDIASWGSGDVTETVLLNQYGEEKAFFSQSIAVADKSL